MPSQLYTKLSYVALGEEVGKVELPNIQHNSGQNAESKHIDSPETHSIHYYSLGDVSWNHHDFTEKPTTTF